MADLFTTKPESLLAEFLRPKSLDEWIGQRHLQGPGKPLHLSFKAGELHSLTLDMGKTTLGRLAVALTASRFG